MSKLNFGQLSVIHSRPDGRKEEGQRQSNIPSKSSAGDNKIETKYGL